MPLSKMKTCDTQRDVRMNTWSFAPYRFKSIRINNPNRTDTDQIIRSSNKKLTMKYKELTKF